MENEEKEYEYVIYATTKGGDGHVFELWHGEDITDFRINSDILGDNVLITIDHGEKDT